MRLLLAITSEERGQLGHRARHEFDQTGGTIGRNASCTWVLPDPTNVLSARHASISYNGRGFEITDTSTNGVYVNAVNTPIGRGNAAFLSHGDTLYLASFELSVAILEDAAEERRRLGVGQAAVTVRNDRSPESPPPPAPFAFATTAVRPGLPDATTREPFAVPLSGLPDAFPPPPSSGLRGCAEGASVDALFEGAQHRSNPSPNPRSTATPVLSPVSQLNPAAGAARIPIDFATPATSAPMSSRQAIPQDIFRDILAVPPQKTGSASTGLTGSIPPAPARSGAVANSFASGALAAASPPGRDSTGGARTSIIPDTIDFGNLLSAPLSNPQRAPRDLSTNAATTVPQASFDLGDGPRSSAQSPDGFARPPISSDIPIEERAAAGVPSPIAAASLLDASDLESRASASSPRREPAPSTQAAVRESEQMGGATSLSAALRADMISLRPPGVDEEPTGRRALDPVAMLRQRAAAGQGPPLPRFDDQSAAAAPSNPNATQIPPASRMRQAASPAAAAYPGGRLAQSAAKRAGDVTNLDPTHGRGAADAFWNGLGLDAASVPPQLQADLLAECGRALREAVAGLVPVLTARRSLKDELRMDQTRLQPKENNPLKFLPSGEAVLQALIDRKLTGFLPLSQAVREGFDDIKAHEVAALVALDAVIKNLLTRFDPASMEAPGASGKLFGRGLDKAKLWDNFVRVHAALSGNLEETTRKLVGEEFARAYAQQVESTRRGAG